MKKIQLIALWGFTIVCLQTNAQIKVYSGGKVCIGSTSVTPSKPLVIAGSGGIRILQSANADSTNEIVFNDNGQIRSWDNKHRIIFDRQFNILEFREYGNIYFSPGDTSGNRNQKITFTPSGDININGAGSSLQINGVKMLWTKNISSDIFIGNGAGANTTGSNNTFTGTLAGNSNTSGANNTANGFEALKTSTTASYDAAFGFHALASNSTGGYNTACGAMALYNNTTGSNNTSVGYYAGQNYAANGSCTFIGYLADATPSNTSNSTALGNGASVNASNKVRIGNASVTVIEGQVAWTNPSDARFKTDVKEDVKGLEFIKKLRPVSYKFNTKAYDQFLMQNLPDSVKQLHLKGIDYSSSSAIIHTGFIAQEVEKAALECNYNFDGVHVPNDKNDNYSIAYSQFVVPLVKAVQELSRHMDSLQQAASKLDSVSKTKDDQLQVLQDKVNQLENAANTGTTFADNSNNAALSSKNNALLYQNKPNPFNNQTTIEYYVPANCAQASILIFDMQGKLMKTIELQQKENGSIKIEANSLYPGMYMYSLVVDGKEMATKRMILTK